MDETFAFTVRVIKLQMTSPRIHKIQATLFAVFGNNTTVFVRSET